MNRNCQGTSWKPHEKRFLILCKRAANFQCTWPQVVLKRETAFIRETRRCKSVAKGARHPPTLLGLARAECKVEICSVSISSAASQQNTASILVLRRCRRRGHRCRVAVVPKCAHTPSRHGRMWTWLLDRGWLGSVVIIINISRRQNSRQYNASELPRCPSVG